MAKKQRTNTPFKFEVVKDADAVARRSRRGQRRSKYSTIGDQLASLPAGNVLTFEASKNEVQGIRNYMRRNFEDTYKVFSRRSEGDNFEVHIAAA
ncbi:MAG TPA: hypothetical protein VF594_03620 [Rubricoccaceae bacterium]|jgi:hypothetical protein